MAADGGFQDSEILQELQNNGLQIFLDEEFKSVGEFLLMT